MSHNSFIRGTGTSADWPLASAVTSAEFAAFDTAQQRCIHEAGGTWSPSALITLGGSGVTMTGPFTLSSTNRLLYASRSFTKILPISAFVSAGATTWNVNNSGGVWINSTASTDVLHIPLTLPLIGTLDSVAVRFKGNTGHGALPAVMPTLKVFRMDSTGATTQLGSTATDSSGSTVAYETIHNIQVSAIAHTIDATANRYHLLFQGESGANAVNSALLYYMAIGITLTSQPEL